MKGANKMATNLLANKTWGVGYYQANAVVNPASEHRYEEEYIEVNPNHYYMVVMGEQSGISWIGYCTYDQNKTYITRVGTQFNGSMIPVKFNSNYVLFSYKLNSSSKHGIGLYDLEDLGIELEEVS